VLLTFTKTFLFLLTRSQVKGKENLPKNGPIILAGNHVAELEAAMMTAYTPGQVEFIGTGDIPMDPRYAFFANAYGIIPVNRGNLDRKALYMGVEVLQQGGILGIFPEGGTWDPAHMQAQPGVAWLSYKAQAPILPIGFGGLKESLPAVLKLQRPQLKMNVGKPLPPVTLPNNNRSLKYNLEYAAEQILNKINELIPASERVEIYDRLDEVYQLEVKVLSERGALEIPHEYQLQHGAAYARVLFNPTVMDVLYRNLRLPIQALKKVNTLIKPDALLKAWQSILNYLEINPGYFTYRFGVQTGLAVKEALQELRRLGQWALNRGYDMIINPIRSYRTSYTGDKVIEQGGRFPASM
jgi:1-acyl-sn-glycerol-3-phosphate acyltransferase